MSLKAVHLIFVIAFSGLAFGCAAWKLKDWLSAQGTSGDLLFALGAGAVGVAVVIYGRLFLKKLKHVNYL